MANPMLDPFGLEASGIPPELAAQYRGLTREQAIAEAMLKQGMASGSGPINAGKFLVAPSPLEGISKIMQVLAGKKMQQDTDKRMSDLGGEFQRNQAQQMADYIRQRSGTPARPAIEAPSEELGGGPGRGAIPATAADPNVDISAMSSTNPRIAQLAKALFAQAQKEADFARAEAGRMTRHTTPSGSAVLSQEGSNQRHVTPSGSAILGNEGANARHVAPSGSTLANIQALGPLRSAQENLARTQATTGGINTYYNTGIAPPGVTVPQQGQQLPPDGAPTPAATNPAEQAAYDQVAQALARGQTGSAAPGGQFAPSATAPIDKPLVPGISDIQSPRARDDAARARASAEATRDARPPSAQAQRMIAEADAAVEANNQVMGFLKQANALNQVAMGFPGAGTVANIGGILPESVRPKAIDATQNLDNIIQNSVLPSLKSTFGGNPTEGERKILLEVAGSSSKPPAVRAEIFKRAQAAAEAKVRFNTERARSLRSGQYFGPSGEPAPSQRGGVMRFDAQGNQIP
jgi:hypothetical protein